MEAGQSGNHSQPEDSPFKMVRVSGRTSVVSMSPERRRLNAERSRQVHPRGLFRNCVSGLQMPIPVTKSSTGVLSPRIRLEVAISVINLKDFEIRYYVDDREVQVLLGALIYLVPISQKSSCGKGLTEVQ